MAVSLSVLSADSALPQRTFVMRIPVRGLVYLDAIVWWEVISKLKNQPSCFKVPHPNTLLCAPRNKWKNAFGPLNTFAALKGNVVWQMDIRFRTNVVTRQAIFFMSISLWRSIVHHHYHKMLSFRSVCNSVWLTFYEYNLFPCDQFLVLAVS